MQKENVRSKNLHEDTIFKSLKKYENVIVIDVENVLVDLVEMSIENENIIKGNQNKYSQ